MTSCRFSGASDSCDYLVITGGEPLKHPEFGSVIERSETRLSGCCSEYEWF
jgi:organic radical activating enzyme